MTKREKVMGVVITVLSLVILCGVAYFASELKYCSVEENEVKFDNIGINEFTTLLNGDTAEIIYIARPGCYYCQQQEPIVKKLISKYELVFHYLNTDELTEADMNKIFAVDVELFGKDGSEFGTPTTLVVKNGKIVDSLVGLTQQTEFESFLTKNGFIK